MLFFRLVLAAGLAGFGALAGPALAQDVTAAPTPSVSPAITPPAIPTNADFPDFTIRVMRGGTELELSGGFKLGIGREFRRILSESPAVRVVHLDSLGGWVNEGEIVRRAIAERGLATYVSDICVSACTVAFAGGSERWLHPSARIGFHTFASSELTSAEVAAYIAREKVILERSGYDAAFVDHALSVPYDDVWYPTDDELLSAHVVTGLAAPDQFALSGLGPDLSRESVAARFASALPILEALRVLEPARFDSMVDAMHAAYLAGATEGELAGLTRSSVLPLVQAYLPLSDDATVLSFASLVVDQYRTLLGTDGSLCFKYAVGVDDPREVLAHFPSPLQQREMHLEEQILRTAEAGRPRADTSVLESYWDEVSATLGSAASAESLSRLAVNAASDPGLQVKYCEASIAFFEGVLSLGEAKASVLFRDFFDGPAAK
jgi:hypothetical protein